MIMILLDVQNHFFVEILVSSFPLTSLSTKFFEWNYLNWKLSKGYSSIWCLMVSKCHIVKLLLFFPSFYEQVFCKCIGWELNRQFSHLQKVFIRRYILCYLDGIAGSSKKLKKLKFQVIFLAFTMNFFKTARWVSSIKCLVNSFFVMVVK